MSPSTGLERPPYLGFLPRFLFRADEGAPAYIVKAWLLAMLPSFALAALVGSLAPVGTETPDIPYQGATPFLLLAVVGPLLETLILAAMVIGLRRVIGDGPAAIVSAILWAIGHSLAAPIWGLIVWWPFLIFGIAILAWRERGVLAAIGVATIIHGLQNATAGLLLLLGQP